MFLPASSAFDEICWRPAADVYRTGTGWLVKLDLAGVRPEDIVIRVSGRCVTVEGTRRDWLIDAGHNYHSLEITYSHFRRCLELPVALEQAVLSTEYQAGMLLVRLETEGKKP